MLKIDKDFTARSAKNGEVEGILANVLSAALLSFPLLDQQVMHCFKLSVSEFNNIGCIRLAKNSHKLGPSFLSLTLSPIA